VQRALLQFFKPENWFTVRDALVAAGREDLIGTGPDALLPPTPPREAVEARRREREERRDADEPTYVHADDAGTQRSVGDRPGRKGGGRAPGKRR
jgi:hypothetical protein